MFAPGHAGTNVAGTVRVTPLESGGTELLVDLTGLTAGEHAWHIHSGACGTEGPIVLPITATVDMEALGAPIQAGEDGRAAAGVTTLGPGPFSLHVHERGGIDAGASVACSNVSAT
jgi:Cu/Zn superoxide dismutase